MTLKELKQECAATERLLNKFQLQVEIEQIINSSAANDATSSPLSFQLFLMSACRID
jgi:hypothetical protein